jgi:hypothetical protein
MSRAKSSLVPCTAAHPPERASGSLLARRRAGSTDIRCRKHSPATRSDMVVPAVAMGVPSCHGQSAGLPPRPGAHSRLTSIEPQINGRETAGPVSVVLGYREQRARERRPPVCQDGGAGILAGRAAP